MPNDSREKILRRIREALSVEAPPRHLAHGGLPAGEHAPAEWLPPVPPSLDGLVSLFEKNSADLKTEVRRCADAAAVGSELAALAREHGWRSVASHRFDLGNPAVQALGLPVVDTGDSYETAALERCDAGISGCDCLVAQTGGIMVTAASAGGRALSVLPPHHVVIASKSQLVGDLADAFAHLRNAHKEIPAFVSFITGPSRTGDIERILVLGAHGPKKLTVLLADDPELISG
ncbi:MAG: lactate utilization protein C [Verrucomicrobiae bacterium]